MTVELGTRVKDKISGFEGIATGRTEYLYGCVRVLVEPERLEAGKPIEGEWFDEQRLVDVPEADAPGGPRAAPRAREDAPKF
jgi:hypothetical protein